MDYRCLVDILLERQRVKELLSVYCNYRYMFEGLVLQAGEKEKISW